MSRGISSGYRCRESSAPLLDQSGFLRCGSGFTFGFLFDFDLVPFFASSQQTDHRRRVTLTVISSFHCLKSPSMICRRASLTKPQIEGEIVDRRYLHSQDLMAGEKVAGDKLRIPSSTREGPLDRARRNPPPTFCFFRFMIPLRVNIIPLRPLRVGITAVHHVDSAVNCLEDVGRSPHPHEITWFLFGEGSR